MDLKPQFIEGVSKYHNIDLEDTESIVKFRNFWDREFKIGQEIIFHLYRRESLTEDSELRSIENDLLAVFNKDNLYVILYLDEKRFSLLFRHEYQLGSSSLILKLWKYFYGLTFFTPKPGIGFDDVIKYYDLHRDTDIYLRSFISKGFTDCAYIKGMDGDTLIKNSIYR